MDEPKFGNLKITSKVEGHAFLTPADLKIEFNGVELKGVTRVEFRGTPKEPLIARIDCLLSQLEADLPSLEFLAGDSAQSTLNADEPA